MILADLVDARTSSLKLSQISKTGNYKVYGASGVCGFLSDYQISKEYIAVVKDGSGVGKSFVAEKESSVLGTMQILVPKNRNSCSYINYLINYMKLGNEHSGAAIPHIYFKNYSKREVPNYSYDKQKEIAKKLDSISYLKNMKEKQLNKLNELIKSQFIQEAFE